MKLHLMTVACISALSTGAVLLAGPTSAGAVDEPIHTFVSMPDFLNSDIGDTRLRAGLGWDAGDPVSTNDVYERAIDVILDEVEAEQPDSVFVAGDLVEGRWGLDVDGTGTFGPVGTLAQKRRAVLNAGNLYYGEWRRRFASRGLTVYPAIGDHEIGDNPWQPNHAKWKMFDTFKSAWARNFVTRWGKGHKYAERPVGSAFEDTAYATYLTPDVLLVTVDVFRRTAAGVVPSVTDAQLRWLKNVLVGTTAQTVIVQGHTPVLGPVRRFASSALMHFNGRQSAFWRTLKAHDVDLYLSGEMHSVTAIDDGVVQVTHGGLAALGNENYLLGNVYADGRIELTAKRLESTGRDVSSRLWQTSAHRPPVGVTYQRGTTTTGTMVIDPAGTVVEQAGNLAPWDGVGP
ncbi:MAG: metallophosphoesterase family protein [Nocardioidaceae bacterium]